MKHVVREDRGLGTAYERYCFYQLLDEWAREYDVESFLEGPIDGMAGIAGVHGVGLARRGVRVVSALPSEEHAEVTRGVYATAGGTSANVVVSGASADEIASLPKSDMVLCYHAFELVPDWRSHLAAVAARAEKALVVAVCNPDNWGVAMSRTVSRAAGRSDAESPEAWHTDVLAPELWKLGRVKAHTYFDCPWWPDVPMLQVAAGQPLLQRLKKIAGGRTKPSAADALEPAGKFTFGKDRWPYFGGEGWSSELLPALLRHPAFEGVRSPTVARRTAHLHAFVVDMRPRTPRERRRLAQLEHG